MTVNDLYNNKLKGGLQLLRWLLFRTGPFADNGNYSNTFIRSGPRDRPARHDGHLHGLVHRRTAQAASISRLHDPGRAHAPNSRGHVRLTGPDPTVRAGDSVQFLRRRGRPARRAGGLKFGRKIAATAPMSDCVEYEITPGKDVSPTTTSRLLPPERACRFCIRSAPARWASTPGGGRSAAQGARGDGLRVADASIMPRIVTGNTNAASIMIGEKAAASFSKTKGAA
jgi:choline dehydrogenase